LKPTIARQLWVFRFLDGVRWPTRILKKNMKTIMNGRNKLFETRFEAETQFEIGPLAPVPVRGTGEAELEQLKARLVRELLVSATEPALSTALQRAADDAASVAWFTPFPLLFFPSRLEEKAAVVRRQQARQREIRQRTQGLLAEAISE
jgi:hypothetical protein